MEYISKVFGSIASAFAIYFVLQAMTTSWTDSIVREHNYESDIAKKIKISEKEIIALRVSLKDLSTTSKEMSGDTGMIVVAAKIDDIRLKNSSLESRISTIESAASIDPKKFLSIPLLEKDISELKTSLSKIEAEQKSQHIVLTSRIDSIMWGILTMALAILAISIPTLLKREKKKNTV